MAMTMMMSITRRCCSRRHLRCCSFISSYYYFFSIATNNSGNGNGFAFLTTTTAFSTSINPNNNRFSFIHDSSKPSSSKAFVSSSLLFSSYLTKQLQEKEEDVIVTETTTQQQQQQNTRQRKPKKTKWITCCSTNEIQRAIQTYVQPGDVVAELGSQLRDVSTTICETILQKQSEQQQENKQHEQQQQQGYAVLVDVERDTKSTSNKQNENNQGRTKAMRIDNTGGINFTSRFSNISTFIEISTLNDWRKAFFFPPSPTKESDDEGSSSGYNVLILDINNIVGNDLELTFISLVKEFLALNECVYNTKCHTVIIKSLRLNRLANRLYNIDNINQMKLYQSQVDYVSSTRRRTNKPTTINSKTSTFPYIIATVGVKEYRRTIDHLVQKGNAVLEVGCHMGTSTNILYQYVTGNSTSDDDDDDRESDGNNANHDDDDDDNDNNDGNGGSGYCIGVDVGSSIINKAKERFPRGVYFAVGDAWSTADLLRIQQQYTLTNNISRGDDDNDDDDDASTPHQSQSRTVGFDIVYVDIGGLSGNDGILESLSLLSNIEYSLEPKYIVIKSSCMKQLSTTLKSFWQVENNKGQTNDSNKE